MDDNKQQTNTLEVSIIDSVALEKLGELTEMGVDSILDNELLKSIPVIGIISKASGAFLAIKERLFLRKIIYFLNEVSNSPHIKRQQFLIDISKDQGSREKAGAALMLLLDKLDDINKPELIGRIYSAKISGSISFEELNRFSMMVTQLYLPDLLDLAKLNGKEKIDDLAAPSFHTIGIAKMVGYNLGTFDGIGAETWYEINELGQKFLSVIFPQ